MIYFDYDDIYLKTSRESVRSLIESYSDEYEKFSTTDITIMINSKITGSDATYLLSRDSMFSNFMEMTIAGELPYDDLESFISFLGDQLECEVRYTVEQTEENDFEELIMCYKLSEFKTHRWLEMNERLNL